MTKQTGWPGSATEWLWQQQQLCVCVCVSDRGGMVGTCFVLRTSVLPCTNTQQWQCHGDSISEDAWYMVCGWSERWVESGKMRDEEGVIVMTE